ncbi:hypothetical protein L195_g025712, partial [Trifolium pratense]
GDHLMVTVCGIVRGIVSGAHILAREANVWASFHRSIQQIVGLERAVITCYREF